MSLSINPAGNNKPSEKASNNLQGQRVQNQIPQPYQAISSLHGICHLIHILKFHHVYCTNNLDKQLLYISVSHSNSALKEC